MGELEAKVPCAGSKRCARPDDEMHGQPRALGTEDVQALVACALKVEREALRGRPGEALWFIAADSQSLRHSFVERFGNKVQLAPWVPEAFTAYQFGGGSQGGSSKARARAAPARSHTATRDALARTFAEWYALSRCDHLVVSRSGFSRTAAVVAKQLRNATVHYVSRLDDTRCEHSQDRAQNAPQRQENDQATRIPTTKRPPQSLLLTGGAGV